MTHIEQMIKDMCPNGVEWKTLGEVCGVQRGKRLTKSELSDSEKYPVYHGGIEPLGFYKEYNREAETVMVINVGASAGTIGYSKEPFWSSDGCFCLRHSDTVIARFIYYYLQTREKEIKSRVRYAGIPTLDGFVVEQFPIPLPPLEIQEKIVECLDKFSALAAELQAELHLRRKQYEYYRTQLLTPHSESNSADNTDDCNWEWKTLGEIGTFTRGRRFVRTDIVEEGQPCIHYGDMYTYYGLATDHARTHLPKDFPVKLRYAEKGDVIIVGAGENDMDIGVGCVWEGDEPVAVHDACYIFKHNQNPRYISHYLRTLDYHLQIKKSVSTAKICAISPDGIAKAKIPLPPLAEQKRIADFLDKFEALLNSLSDGIPAEQAAQQKRYEYYRDLLLTFPRK